MSDASTPPQFGRHVVSGDGKVVTITLRRRELRWRWFRRVPRDVTLDCVILDGDVVLVDNVILDAEHPLRRAVVAEITQQLGRAYVERVQTADTECEGVVERLLASVEANFSGDLTHVRTAVDRIERDLLTLASEGLRLLRPSQTVPRVLWVVARSNGAEPGTPVIDAVRSILQAQIRALRRLCQFADLARLVVTREADTWSTLGDDLDIAKARVDQVSREHLQPDTLEKELASHIEAVQCVLSMASGAGRDSKDTCDSYRSALERAATVATGAQAVFYLMSKFHEVAE